MNLTEEQKQLLGDLQGLFVNEDGYLKWLSVLSYASDNKTFQKILQWKEDAEKFYELEKNVSIFKVIENQKIVERLKKRIGESKNQKAHTQEELELINCIPIDELQKILEGDDGKEKN